MALYDRRTLDGVYSVRQSVIYIQNYRYAEERMMRMMAGWIALTPELDGQAGDGEAGVRRRAAYRRARKAAARTARAAAGVQAAQRRIRHVHERDRGQGRVGGYDRAAGWNLSGAEAASDFPLQLARVGDESGLRAADAANPRSGWSKKKRGTSSAGNVLLDELLDSKEKHRRASDWQAHLEELLGASGGVTGFRGGSAGPRRKVGRS